MSNSRVVSCLILLSFAAFASGAPAPWDTPAGSGNDFTYSGGQTDQQRFGDPVLQFGNNFLFSPRRFAAVASNGETTTTQDVFSVQLNADPGLRFDMIRVDLLGDFAVLGPASVTTVGSLSVKNLATNVTLSFPVVTNPTFPAGGGVGLWSGSATASLPAGWKDVLVSFEHGVTASSEFGGTGVIELKGANMAVSVVPLPAAALAAPGAFAVMFVARRRMQRRR